MPVSYLDANRARWIESPCQINDVRPHDTVLHHGVLRTVCATDVKRGFMGSILFGDSYRAGTLPVTRMLFKD